MRQPPDRRRESPGTLTGAPHKNSSTTTEPVTSVDEGMSTVADIGSPVVQLIHELTNIPLPVIATLVVERLDGYADYVLDQAWAREQRRLYPDAVRSAHNRHAMTYTQRRAREWADVPPRPTDHSRGRSWPTLRLVGGRNE
jgi:hypothetical protein